MSHFVKKCKHGRIYGQCRCASPNKVEIRVACGDECPETEGFSFPWKGWWWPKPRPVGA